MPQNLFKSLDKTDKKWYIKIGISIVVGFIVGKFIAVAGTLILTMLNIGLDYIWLLDLFVPAGIVVGLLVVLMQYNNDKFDRKSNK